MNKIRFRDKLRDRGFIDQWGFLSFAAAGFFGILLAKAYNAPPLWVAIGATVLMLSYAIIIGRSGTGRLRADQAGDNCYYLGLIYTLASLSFAIATFDPGSAATTIIQGFGIALATTVAGLVLRVFFNQGRPDLENHEEQVRLELTEASARLKGEVHTVAQNMNGASRVLMQSMEEMHKAATASIEQFAKATIAEIGKVVEEASATIRSEANDFASRSKRYSTSFDKLLAKLEEQSSVVEQISRAHDALLGSVDASVTAATTAATAVRSLHDGADSARATADAARAAVGALEQMTSNLSAAAKGLEGGVLAFNAEVQARISELRDYPTESVAAALTALNGAAAAIGQQIRDADELHRRVHADLVARNEVAVGMANRHSQSLELELERSRAMVNKLHSSLADMTESLAATMEATRS